MTEIYAVIMAGGTGSRMRSDIPKQFMKLDGRPILTYTTGKFAAFSEFAGILVTSPEDWMQETEELLREDFPDRTDIYTVAGGDSRNDTMMNAIAFIRDHLHLDEDTVIVTHDCVRPFVSGEVIRANLEAGLRYEASTTAIPAADTIMESLDGEMVRSVPNRAHMYQVQTPQTFRAQLLWDYYRKLSDEEREIMTEACKIMLLNGTPVHIIPGEQRNFKITYPSDLAEAGVLFREEKDR